jgi:large subunit ribosomal protein L21
MTKYAVIRIKGHQYRVEEGEELLVDKLSEKEKPEAEVLLVKDKKTKVGTPTVKGSSVKLKVLEKEEKRKKIHVETFKAKSRYRRKIGFRPKFTRLKVEKITS